MGGSIGAVMLVRGGEEDVVAVRLDERNQGSVQVVVDGSGDGQINGESDARVERMAAMRAGSSGALMLWRNRSCPESLILRFFCTSEMMAAASIGGFGRN